MARNGSGTMAIVNTFTPSTTISSAAVNANFSDIGDEITNSVAADGQTTLTAAIKGANGSATTPAYGFGSDTNTGMYRKAADSLGFATAGSERAYFDSAGKLFALGAFDVAGASNFQAATQHTTIELGHASDTTLARASAGEVTIEGNAIYRAGGTDVAIADGGTGASTAADAFTALKQAATESATGVVELATVAEAETGTDTSRAVTPAGVLASIVANGGWQTIESSSVSNASEAIVDISGYDLVQIWVSVRPNTDSQVINIRMSQDGGSTFLSGADDYSWFTRWGGDYLSDTSDSEIEIGGDGSGIDNVIASELIFYLRKPNGTGNRKTLTIEGGLPDGTAAAFDTFHGQGRLEDNTNAVDALRFFAASGNITMEWHAIGMNLS